MASIESTDAKTQLVPMAFVLNGEPVDMAVEPHVILLDLLRDRLGLTGVKRSCDVQVCGSCTVLVDGRAVSSCTYLAFEARGATVLTIEGLSGVAAPLHPLMAAFVDNAGFQCGYCTPGMILTAKALLDENPRPDGDQIKQYMRGNICRCTGYKRIVDAILDAAERMAGRAQPGGRDGGH